MKVTYLPPSSQKRKFLEGRSPPLLILGVCLRTSVLDLTYGPFLPSEISACSTVTQYGTSLNHQLLQKTRSYVYHLSTLFLT